MRTKILALLALSTLAGCVSKKNYDQLVSDQQRINEQKDSLVADVLATTSMVTEINSELTKITGLGISPVSSNGDRRASGKAEDRAILLGKIREVISRLTAAEKAVEDQKQKVGQMTEQRRKLVAQLEAFRGTIEELKATALNQEALITEQREQIKTLASKVDTLTQETDRLAVEREAISDTLKDVVDESNTVYYAVGTKEELLKMGVVVEEGSKFLVFGSKTVQPARDLDPNSFQRLDRRVDTVLTVPEPTREYKIITRQDPQYLGSTVTSKGKVKGDLLVSNQAFWEGSRFLILVRD